MSPQSDTMSPSLLCIPLPEALFSILLIVFSLLQVLRHFVVVDHIQAHAWFSRLPITWLHLHVPLCFSDSSCVQFMYATHITELACICVVGIRGLQVSKTCPRRCGGQGEDGRVVGLLHAARHVLRVLNDVQPQGTVPHGAELQGAHCHTAKVSASSSTSVLLRFLERSQGRVCVGDECL